VQVEWVQTISGRYRFALSIKNKLFDLDDRVVAPRIEPQPTSLFMDQGPPVLHVSGCEMRLRTIIEQNRRLTYNLLFGALGAVSFLDTVPEIVDSHISILNGSLFLVTLDAW
jgi:hypothetical protein